MTTPPITRRRFLAIAGGTAGVVALAPILSACEASPPAGPSAYMTPAWQEGFSKVTPVEAFVLAAAGGLRLQQSWTGANAITLLDDEVVIATYEPTVGPSVLNEVSDATFASDGSVWIVDRGARRLVHLDAELRPIETIDTADSAPLLSPAGIESLPDGTIVATDTRRGILRITTSASGTSTASILVPTAPGFSTNVVSQPREIVARADGTFIVHSLATGLLESFTSSGTGVGEPIELDEMHTSFIESPSGDIIGFNASNRTITRVGSDGSLTSHHAQRSGTSGAIGVTPLNDSIRLFDEPGEPGLPAFHTTIRRITIDRPLRDRVGGGEVFVSVRTPAPASAQMTSTTTTQGN